MAYPSRKLLSDSINDKSYELCSSYCESSNNLPYYCESNCYTYCSTFCPYDLSPSPTSFSPIPNHPNKLLIIVISLLATTLALFLFYALYVKFYINQSRMRRRRRLFTQETNQPHEEFSDDEHGQIVDHPTWYINTIGLQPSIISCITVCKFKKGDGLVEGTECSVCLNEFQEDETLRLLPKCNHAFHVQCIDTWLRAHTNCPMCRAPIVANTATPDGTGDPEETQIGVPENGGVTSGRVRDESGELITSLDHNGMPNSDGLEKNGVLTIRRSVSLDDSCALEMGSAMANATTLEFDGNSDVQMEERNENDSGSNRSFSSSATATSTAATSGGPHLFGSSSNSAIRSLSCSGALFAARYTRNRTSVRPL